MAGFSCSRQVGKCGNAIARCCPMLPVFPNKSLQVRDTELVIILAQAYQKSFRSSHSIDSQYYRKNWTKMTSSKLAFEPGVTQHMIQPRSRADITDTDWMHVIHVIVPSNLSDDDHKHPNLAMHNVMHSWWMHACYADSVCQRIKLLKHSIMLQSACAGNTFCYVPQPFYFAV